MYDRILIAIDESDGAERAIEHALDLAATEDATLYGLHVVDTRNYGEPALSSTELVVDDAEDAGNHLLELFEQRAAAAGVSVETRCVHGIPHQTILEYSTEIDADLIVLGYESKNRRQYIGSVTKAIVDTSERPVHTP